MSSFSATMCVKLNFIIYHTLFNISLAVCASLVYSVCWSIMIIDFTLPSVSFSFILSSCDMSCCFCALLVTFDGIPFSSWFFCTLWPQSQLLFFFITINFCFLVSCAHNLLTWSCHMRIFKNSHPLFCYTISCTSMGRRCYIKKRVVLVKLYCPSSIIRIIPIRHLCFRHSSSNADGNTHKLHMSRRFGEEKHRFIAVTQSNL